MKAYWHGKLDALTVHTPDDRFNTMINTWNAFQCFTTFVWSRAASLIYCGQRNGLGYRDTVQDIQGIIHLDPAMAKGCFRGAPTMVFIARDKSYDFSTYDCGLLAENMVLSAWSMGIGSICLGSPVRFLTDNPECLPYLERLGFSEGYELSLCVGFGYADEAPAAKPRDWSKVQYVD